MQLPQYAGLLAVARPYALLHQELPVGLVTGRGGLHKPRTEIGLRIWHGSTNDVLVQEAEPPARRIVSALDDEPNHALQQEKSSLLMGDKESEREKSENLLRDLLISRGLQRTKPSRTSRCNSCSPMAGAVSF